MLKLCKKRKLVNVSTAGSSTIQEAPCKIIRYIGDNIPNDIQWVDGDLYIRDMVNASLDNITNFIKVYRYVSSLDSDGDATFIEDSLRQGYLYFNAQTSVLSICDNGELISIFDPQAQIGINDVKGIVDQEIDTKLPLLTGKIDQVIIPQVDDPEDPTQYEYHADGQEETEPMVIGGVQEVAPPSVTPTTSQVVYIDKITGPGLPPLVEEIPPPIDPGLYLMDTETNILYENWEANNSTVSKKDLETANLLSVGNTGTVRVKQNNNKLSNNRL